MSFLLSTFLTAVIFFVSLTPVSMAKAPLLEVVLALIQKNTKKLHKDIKVYHWGTLYKTPEDPKVKKEIGEVIFSQRPVDFQSSIVSKHVHELSSGFTPENTSENGR